MDVAKPITDLSHLEIEKSTLKGLAYQTGGGRTVNANVIDILTTWMVNHDQGEFMQGGVKGATKPGMTKFPYFASPNDQLQTISQKIDVAATPDDVWALIGSFGSLEWHPLVAKVKLAGAGIGQLRTVETIDGKKIVEQLITMDSAARTYTYEAVGGLPAASYKGSLGVTPKGTGSSIEWQAQYLADGQPDIIVKTIISTLLKVGLESLKKRFA